MSFCIWFVSLSIVSLMFIRVVACVRISFLRLNNIPLYTHTHTYTHTHHSLFIHLSTDRHLDHVFSLPIVNNAAHMSVQISIQVPASSSFGEIPRSGIGGSYANVIFTFLRNCCAVFHSACTIVHSHLQCT